MASAYYITQKPGVMCEVTTNMTIDNCNHVTDKRGGDKTIIISLLHNDYIT